MGDIDQRINQKLFGNLEQANAEEFTKAQMGINCTNPKDYNTYSIVVKAPFSFPLQVFFDQAPTKVLYSLIEMIQRSLSKREDAKR